MNWIDQIMEATAEAETPRSFIKWAAIASISATVADRVYLDKFYYKLYPNLYVLLIADSGLRKGFAAWIANALVRPLDITRVIGGRNSIEAIVKELSTAVTAPGKPPLTKAHGFIVSGELSTTFLENPATFNILLDLYDGHYHPEWKNTLKSGVEVLKDISIAMLGAINPTLFKTLITRKDVTGGFLARCVIVEEKKRACKNSLTKPPSKALNIDELRSYLKKLSTISGQFVWDPDTATFFDQWYNAFDPEGIEDETGTANRIHDQITKVAMNLSLAESTDLVIRQHHIDGAMQLLNQALHIAGMINRGQGLSDLAPKIRIVWDELISAKDGKILRSELLRKHWGNFSAAELDTIVNTMVQFKGIRIIQKPGSKGDEYYVATQELYDAFEALKERLGGKK